MLPWKVSDNEHAKIKATASRKIILVHYTYIKQISWRNGVWSALNSFSCTREMKFPVFR